MNDFITWLNNELRERGWLDSEFARRAELSRATVSMVFSSQSNPGLEFCLGTARALKIPPEEILQRAGLLPQLPAPADDPTLSELLKHAKRMTTANRLELLKFARYLYQQQAPAATPGSDIATA